MTRAATDLELTPGKGPRKPAPVARRVQVLALSGGGYRGLYSAHLLANIEQHYKGTSVSKQFNLIIGTSTGALIATALALGVPPATIVQKFITHGPKIFDGGRGLTAKAGKTLISSPYKAQPLREAILDTIGADHAKVTMADIAAPLAVCAVNFTHGRAEIFRSKGLARTNANRTKVVDAVLASAAAPTYFPAHQVGVETFIDGGIVANAPDLQGIVEAQTHVTRKLSDLYLLAVGTASRRKGAPLVDVGAASTMSWLLSHDLYDATLAAQEQLARTQAAAILGERYYLLNREPLENQVADISGLDVVTTASTRTLISLADETWADAKGDQRLRRFFNVAA